LVVVNIAEATATRRGEGKGMEAFREVIKN
jgi:hypothetical protein